MGDKILKLITDVKPKAILSEAGEDTSLLEKQLDKYTRKVTSDFFIHKHLKDFLERELDYFNKTEVLDLKNLDERHVARALFGEERKVRFRVIISPSLSLG